MTFAILALLAGWVAAAGPGPSPGSRMKPAAASKRTLSREAITVSEVAQKFGVAESEVRSLRARGLGWGGTQRALAISTRVGRPPAEIVELQESGLSWSEVARAYGLEPVSAAEAAAPGELRDALSGGKEAARPGAPGAKRAPTPGQAGTAATPR